MTNTILSALALAFSAATFVYVLLTAKKLLSPKDDREQQEALRRSIAEELSRSQQASVSMTTQSLGLMSDALQGSQQNLQKSVSDSVAKLDERFGAFSQQNDQKLETMRSTIETRLGDIQKENKEQLESVRKTVDEKLLQNEQRMEGVRTTIESRLRAIQDDNEKQLDKMRATVDEKLQKSLDEKFNQSFKLVSDRLEQVYKGLGEMQNLASGVGDLKKVLSNVKTRGILGEIQLGAILSEILSPDQYEQNVETRKGSGKYVEYAVKMPGEQGDSVYLPIDAKFPMDAYSDLLAAYDSGDAAEVERAATLLISRIKSFAKDISDKYISPPETTDFAIMFLPVEGLYAEVVRRGMVETLQRDYRVNIAGPTTMAALLNSLQMGFKTLAIQKRSSEVWKVLAAVKGEFETFGQVLERTQSRLSQAGAELDKLVGVRTRQIQRKLKDVTALPGSDPAAIEDGEDPLEIL